MKPFLVKKEKEQVVVFEVMKSETVGVGFTFHVIADGKIKQMTNNQISEYKFVGWQ